jgi:hypothetical protein
MITELLAIPNMNGYPTEIPEGFNWFAVLKDLSAGAPCSINDQTKLSRMAGNWVTCACGQLCSVLPRNNMGRPLDVRLQMLGTAFFHRIEEKKWCEALSVLHRIEERSNELLERMSE